MEPTKPAVMSSRELWRIAIALLMEKRKPLNAEQVKHSTRQERYPHE
jgi:hypothetical protein